MHKKLICGIVSLVLVFSNIITTYAVLPKNMAGSGISAGNCVVFSDDFKHGANLWTQRNIECNPFEGRVRTAETGNSNLHFYDEELELKDAEYNITFKPIKENNGMMRIDIGKDQNLYSVLIRSSGISLLPIGAGELPQVRYPFVVGTEYDVKIEETGDMASISFKEKAQEEYMSVGTLQGTDASNGYFMINTVNGYAADINNITVLDKSIKSLSFQTKYRYLNVNEPTLLEVSTRIKSPLVYSSSDEAIATIDENGVLTGLKGGSVKIMVQTEDGAVCDECYVTIYVPVTAMAIQPGEFDEMYVGQTEVVVGQWLPKDATNTSFSYTIDDPEIARLNGGNNEYQSITAVAPGHTIMRMISADGMEKTKDIYVLEQKEAEKTSARFTFSGESKEIPSRFFGVHHSKLMGTYPMRTFELNPESVDYAEKVDAALMKDIGFQSIRSYWTWWNWKTSNKWNEDGTETETPYNTTIEQIYSSAHDAGAKFVISFSAFSTVDEMVEEFLEIKKVDPGYEIYIEYGNETYAINEQNRIATIDVYIERLRELSRRIKEIDPTVKIGVPVLDYRLERAIFNDPNNYPDGEENWEYTQGIRALTWNAALSENADSFDAIIPHMYAIPDILGTNYQNELICTVDDFMGKTRGTNRQAHQFPGKEVWVTEYGIFPNALRLSTNAGKFRDMEQNGKCLGAAMVDAAACLLLLDTNSTVTSLHYSVDPQGFGIAQPDYIGGITDNPEDYILNYLPHYYLYKELGKLFKENTHYYDTLNYDGKYTSSMLDYNQEKQWIDVPHVLAFGFGDKDGVKKVAMLNMMENPVEISIDNSKVKPIVHYWDENIWPTLHNWPGSYTDMPEYIPLPEDIVGSSFSDKVELKPYSFTVMEVSAENVSGISKEIIEKMGASAIYMKDSAYAYDEAKRVDMDPYNDGHAAKQINGNTYIPMRSIEQVADQFITYSKEDDIATYSILEYRDLLTEKESEVDISKVTSVETGLQLINAFYWNSSFSINTQTGDVVGDVIIRDEVEDINIPESVIMIDGTTYITAEMAAKLIGFELKYYNEDLIVMSQNDVTLTNDEVSAILKEFRR